MNLTPFLITLTDIDQVIGRLQAIVADVRHIIDQAAYVALPTAAAFAVAYVVLRFAAPTITALLWPPKRVAVRIVPAAESTFKPEAWTIFYRSLLAITPPAWKRLVRGVPWVTPCTEHPGRI